MAVSANAGAEGPARLRVFCAGAARSALGQLPQAFEQRSGVAVDFTLGPVGGLVEKLRAGEKADVVVLGLLPLEKLAAEGMLVAGTIGSIGSVGFAIAQRRGETPLDVSTTDLLRSALLTAKSFAYGDPRTGDSSGVHLAGVLQRLGIAQAMQDKAVLEPLGLAVAQAVAEGRAEIGALQTSIILARDDLQLAGNLPAEFQHTTTYAMAMVRGAHAASTEFLACLQSPEARAQFRTAGFAPV
ncbi:MAG TPA: substrate-binding domain-containing protein [Burkholderiales bacterium]|jgi:molybdate transport system substrate-binding protein|nr:substrate-binding domain-containing protein [Burkholderiales bacterium]